MLFQNFTLHSKVDENKLISIFYILQSYPLFHMNQLLIRCSTNILFIWLRENYLKIKPLFFLSWPWLNVAWVRCHFVIMIPALPNLSNKNISISEMRLKLNRLLVYHLFEKFFWMGVVAMLSNVCPVILSSSQYQGSHKVSVDWANITGCLKHQHFDSSAATTIVQ